MFAGCCGVFKLSGINVEEIMDRRSFVTGLVVGGAVGAGAASVLNKPNRKRQKLWLRQQL